MRRYLVYLLLISVACGESVSPQDYSNLYQQAKQAYNSRYYGQALEFTQQALPIATTGPDSTQTYYLQYLSYFNLQDYTQAGTRLQFAIHYSTQPTEFLTYYTALTHLYYTLGAFPEAHQAGQQTLRYISEDTDPAQLHNYYLFNALRAATQIEDIEAAEALEALLLQIDPSYLTPENLVYYRAAQILHFHRAKNHEAAIQAGLAVFDNLPSDKVDLTWVHNNVGLAYAATGEANKALHHYHEALRYTPQNPGILNNIAAVYHRLSQTEKVVNTARQITDIPFSSVEPRYYDLVRQAYRVQIRGLGTLGLHEESQATQDRAYQFDIRATHATTRAITTLAVQLTTIRKNRVFELDSARQHAEILKLERKKSRFLLGAGITLLALLLGSLYLLWRNHHYRRRHRKDEHYYTQVHQAVIELEESLKRL